MVKSHGVDLQFDTFINFKQSFVCFQDLSIKKKENTTQKKYTNILIYCLKI